jgi:four helix bundle protein
MQAQKTDLSDRFIEFSAEVIKLVSLLPNTFVSRRITDQLIRSAMSVGANYEEARGASSRADFSHKLQISLKEMRESRYWLFLIAKTAMIKTEQMSRILDEATQLRAILSKAVATSRGKSRSQRTSQEKS